MRTIGTVEFWTIAAGVIGLFALIFSIYVFRHERTRRGKHLTIEIVSLSTLLNEKAKIDGKHLQILFGDELVSNFAVSQIRVINSGGSPIISADFEGPLDIKYDNVEKIYSYEVKDVVPLSLSPRTLLDGNSVKVAPLLLNPGDSFVVEAGLELKDNDLIIKPSGRISGISEIKVSRESDRESRSFLAAAGWGFLGGILLAAVLAFGVFPSAP